MEIENMKDRLEKLKQENIELEKGLVKVRSETVPAIKKKLEAERAEVTELHKANEKKYVALRTKFEDTVQELSADERMIQGVRMFISDMFMKKHE